MKIIKNCLFYLFLGIAAILTLMGLCIVDTESILAFIGYLVTVAASWVIVIAGFCNQLMEYLAKKWKSLEKNDEDYIEVVGCEKVHPRLRETYQQEFEECYHIAVNAHADRVLATINK